LIFDIETRPLRLFTFRAWGDQYIPYPQVDEDMAVLSWSAMWHGSKKIMYEDNKGAKDYCKDKRLCKSIRDLLDEADIVVTQNGKSFDVPKLFARFIINGLKRPSAFKHIDTKIIAKKFGFTYCNLAYLAKVLKTEHQKLTHTNFPGMALWMECLKRNRKAWAEMKLYNKHDTLVLSEVWEKLEPWNNSINFNLYTDEIVDGCNCGGKFVKNGHHYSDNGKFQRYFCNKCHAPVRDKKNLFSKEKKKSLKKRIA
jgi:hypothetical protein